MVAKQDVSVARLTTTEAAVLALLAIEGARSAYDLVKLVEQAIAHVWSPARSGLYAVLRGSSTTVSPRGAWTAGRIDATGSSTPSVPTGAAHSTPGSRRSSRERVTRSS